jgi:hypothetical protein
MESVELDGVPLVSKAEAIAEVRRWLDVEHVDPEAIFSAAGDQVIRYKDLIAHLEQDTPDGTILRFAISRGRAMKGDRGRARVPLLEIAPLPTAPGTDEPPDPPPSDPATPPT